MLHFMTTRNTHAQNSSTSLKTTFEHYSEHMKPEDPNGRNPKKRGSCEFLRDKCSVTDVSEAHLRIIRERMQKVDSGAATSRSWSEIRIKYLPMTGLFLILLFTQSVSGIDVPSVTDTLSVLNDTVQESISGQPYQYTETDYYDPDNDWAPGLGLMALFLILASLFTIGAGIVVSLFILSVFTILVVLGVLSTSLLIGISKKSFALGLKVFLLSSSVIFSTLVLSVLTFALNHHFHWGSPNLALTIGAGVGALIGLLLGWLVFQVLRKISTFVVARLYSDQTPS